MGSSAAGLRSRPPPLSRHSRRRRSFRPVGTSAWQKLGTDDAQPYSVYHDVSGYRTGHAARVPRHRQRQQRQLHRDVDNAVAGAASARPAVEARCDHRAARRTAGAGDRGQLHRSGHPARLRLGSGQPGLGSVTGSNAGDWQPDCADDQMTLDPNDGIWKATIHAARRRLRIQRQRSTSPGMRTTASAPSGADPTSRCTSAAGRSPLLRPFDPLITSDAQGPIVTATESMQSGFGCMADWQPQCMNPWLQDPDGDGHTPMSPISCHRAITSSRSLTARAGMRTTARAGCRVPNVPFSVSKPGVVITITYVLATHEITVTTSEFGRGSRDLKARPRRSGCSGPCSFSAPPTRSRRREPGSC